MAYYFIEQLGEEHEHLAEYHYTKGIYHQIGNWEFQKAQIHLSKALAINPNYSEALEAKADLLITIGNFVEAKKCIEKAVETNPNAINHHFVHALLHYYQKEFDKSIVHLDQALAMDATWEMAIQLKTLCAIQLRNNVLYNKVLSKLPKSDAAGFHVLKEAFDNQVEINETIDYKTYFFPVEAGIQVRLGKHDSAMDILKESIANRSGQYIGFAFDPLLEPLKTDERFQKYVAHFHNSASALLETKTPVKEESIFSEEETAHFLQSLNELMLEEKAFLDSQLSLREVAQTLDLHPNKLSWLINHEIGKGFNDFLNHFRLQEFKQLALNPDYKHLTLLGLAFESGFNSKSVFNDYFKKSTGTTPKKWISSASK